MEDCSNARNTGGRAATADWIIFLDSDDYYDRRTVEYLMGLKEQYKVDLVSTPVIEVRNHEGQRFFGRSK